MDSQLFHGKDIGIFSLSSPLTATSIAVSEASEYDSTPLLEREYGSGDRFVNVSGKEDDDEETGVEDNQASLVNVSVEEDDEESYDEDDEPLEMIFSKRNREKEEEPKQRLSRSS